MNTAKNASPSKSSAEAVKNFGGQPPTKDCKAIDKQNTPPKTSPSDGASKSVRV